MMKVHEVISRLEADGFLFARQSGSSHRIYKKAGHRMLVTIAGKMSDTMATGTLRSIFRQAGWEWPPR